MKVFIAEYQDHGEHQNFGVYDTPREAEREMAWRRENPGLRSRDGFFVFGVGYELSNKFVKPRKRDGVRGQCGYHYGPDAEGLRVVRLTHRPGSGEWQERKSVCPRCREYLRGFFKYDE